MKETTSARLRKLLSERDIKQIDVLRAAEPYCKKYGIKLSKSDFSQYVSGKTVPGQDKLTVIGLAMNVSEAWLMGYDVPMERRSGDDGVPPGFEPLPKTVKRPLVGNIACGEPITAEENIEDYVDVPESVHCDFCLRCKGDSMVDAGIHDGDIVFIRSQPQVENGEIAAVLIGSEATLKRFFLHDDYVELRPDNAAYESIIRRRDAMNDVTIEGKAVGFVHWF